MQWMQGFYLLLISLNCPSVLRKVTVSHLGLNPDSVSWQFSDLSSLPQFPQNTTLYLIGLSRGLNTLINKTFLKQHMVYNKYVTRGLPWWLSGKESACQCRRHSFFHLQVGKIPQKKKWQPTPVFLPGKSHGQRSLWAIVHGVAKESDMTWRLNNNKKMYITLSYY